MSQVVLILSADRGEHRNFVENISLNLSILNWSWICQIICLTMMDAKLICIVSHHKPSIYLLNIF